MNDEKAIEEVKRQGEFLKRNGVWTTTLADAFPLLLANWSHRPVIIYTSRLNQPIKVLPTDSDVNESPIVLALTATANFQDHYDAVTPTQSESSVNDGEIEANISRCQ